MDGKDFNLFALYLIWNVFAYESILSGTKIVVVSYGINYDYFKLFQQ